MGSDFQQHPFTGSPARFRIGWTFPPHHCPVKSSPSASLDQIRGEPGGLAGCSVPAGALPLSTFAAEGVEQDVSDRSQSGPKRLLGWNPNTILGTLRPVL